MSPVRRAFVAVFTVALVSGGVGGAVIAHAATGNAACVGGPLTHVRNGDRFVATCTAPGDRPVSVTLTAHASPSTPTPTPSPSASPSSSPTPTFSATPTPTMSPTPTLSATPTPTSTPPPAGFPDASNTGYRNAPGYTGTLKSGAGLVVQSGQTYTGYDFPGGLSVGTHASPVSNVTFIGCRFHGAGDVLVTVFGSNLKFSYDSFEPANAAPPTAHAQGYEYGISADGAYYTHAEGLSMDHLDMWGFANAITLAHSTQAQPVSLTDSWIHDARADGGSDHTDGIGELQGNAMSFVTIDHNTIVSAGNTNGIAFQYGPYSDFTVTNNLIGGWGYAVNIGGASGSVQRILFTGNQWAGSPPPVFGPVYSDRFATGTGDLWRNNRWSDSRFWTPSGPSATDYTG